MSSETEPTAQGMGTALQRIGQNVEGSTGSGVRNDDPDLVAYWTFDEGRGYVVHDVTQRGHDLYLTSEPHWEVSFIPYLTGNICLLGLLVLPGQDCLS